jgi:hypothetical protein
VKTRLAALALLGAVSWGFAEEPPALYHADLGPAKIDVTRYPRKQREAYGLFELRCAQCHTLARAINSPIATRSAWKHYIVGRMRVYGAVQGRTAYTKAEVKAITDFLVFDSNERKIKRRDEFDQLTEKLELRFAEMVEEQWRASQSSATRRDK